MFLSIHGRHLEVEINLWGIRLSTNVHQTVDADGVVGKRVTDVKVGEADAVNGIDCLKVECCIIRIASKDNRTSAIEGEVLLNDMKPLKGGESIWKKFKHWMKDVNIKASNEVLSKTEQMLKENGLKPTKEQEKIIAKYMV